MLMALGVVDDRSDVHWSLRFLGQAIALLPMILIDGVVIHSFGNVFGGHPLLLGPLAIPVTLFMGLGAINALNMIDGADGLATSLGLTALVLTSAVAAISGQTSLAVTLLTMAAALAGFLALNLRTPWQPRAVAFLGNGGSDLLGLVLAWAVLRLTQAPEGTVAPVLAPFLIGPALLDCVAVMSRRLIGGRSPFRAASDHFHHILLRGGRSVSGVVGTAVGGALVFAFVPMLGWQLGMTETALALVLIASLVAYVGWQQFMVARQAGAIDLSARRAACPAE
jgi:UDP-GlcNAc:undecaprenyl-phosphate GlcNAc-1-phosphate transferase